MGGGEFGQGSEENGRGCKNSNWAQRDVVKIMSRDGHSINYTVNENDYRIQFKLTQVELLSKKEGEEIVVTDEIWREKIQSKLIRTFLFFAFLRKALSIQNLNLIRFPSYSCSLRMYSINFSGERDGEWRGGKEWEK